MVRRELWASRGLRASGATAGASATREPCENRYADKVSAVGFFVVKYYKIIRASRFHSLFEACELWHYVHQYYLAVHHMTSMSDFRRDITRTFDIDDITGLEQQGTFEGVILHEVRASTM